MTEFCPECDCELVFFSSDFGSTRYYCSECRNYYSIRRNVPIEEKTVISPAKKKRQPKKSAVKRMPKKKIASKTTKKKRR